MSLSEVAPRRPPDLAIVIPAWNERKNLELLLPAVKEEVAGLGLTADIVVVDGGSHDATRAAAEARGARTVVQRERGYGGVLLTGFAATTAPYIVTMDAVLSHRPVFSIPKSSSTSQTCRRVSRK
jgi:dolichol-phosphate mannosyltransferase